MGFDDAQRGLPCERTSCRCGASAGSGLTVWRTW